MRNKDRVTELRNRGFAELSLETTAYLERRVTLRTEQLLEAKYKRSLNRSERRLIQKQLRKPVFMHLEGSTFARISEDCWLGKQGYEDLKPLGMSDATGYANEARALPPLNMTPGLH